MRQKRITYRPGTRLLPGKVTIAPCHRGMGYFYGGECFAYVWAMRPFTKDWWSNLLLVAGCDPQECERAGKILKEKRCKS